MATHQQCRKYCRYHYMTDNIDETITKLLYDENNLLDELCMMCFNEYVVKNEIDIINKISDDDTDAMFVYGKYYYYYSIKIKMLADRAEKYLLLASKFGNIRATIELGDFYRFVKLDQTSAKQCYLFAIDRNNSTAMYKLGYYYQFHEVNYDLTKKYYLMAIYGFCSCDNKNKPKCQKCIIYGYCCCENNNVTECYDCAIKYGNSEAMCNLGTFYQQISNINKAVKYYSMSAQKNNVFAMSLLISYYIDKKMYESAKKYCLKAIQCPTVYEFSMKNCFTRLRDFMSPTRIYFSVNNRKYFIHLIQPVDLVIINTFINKSSDEMCELCFMHTKCINVNNKYICGVCL